MTYVTQMHTRLQLQLREKVSVEIFTRCIAGSLCGVALCLGEHTLT